MNYANILPAIDMEMCSKRSSASLAVPTFAKLVWRKTEGGERLLLGGTAWQVR